MAKKSLFGRLANVFKEEEEESAEDIDKAVEAAVAETMSAEVDTIGAAAVLSSGTGDLGDTVYILDLEPIYEMIGGRKGRAAEGLLDICKRQFDDHRESPKDSAIIKGDHFVMRFDKCDNEQGFRRAAIVINDIGYQVLSDRFEQMEIPDILVAADVADVTNEDGTLNADKIGDVQKSGGLTIVLENLAEDVPKWARLVVKKLANTARLVTMNRKKKNDDIEMVEIKHEKAIADGDIKMVEIKRERKKEPEYEMVEIKRERKKDDDIEMVQFSQKQTKAKPDWMQNAMKAEPGATRQHIKRSGMDRRVRTVPVGAKNKRSGGLDRRGRGH